MVLISFGINFCVLVFISTTNEVAALGQPGSFHLGFGSGSGLGDELVRAEKLGWRVDFRDVFKRGAV